MIYSPTQQMALLSSLRVLHESHIPISIPPYEPANEKFAEFHQCPAKIRAIFGANRAGKSEAGAAELVQLCRDHPGVTVWATTVSYEALGQYVAEKIFKRLHPAEIEIVAWVNRLRNIPAVIRLKNGSRIVFKSYDQGRERWQGASVYAVWLDEECNQEMFTEAMARTIDCGGKIILTMTPLKGLTWAYTRIYQAPNQPGDDIRHWTITLFENKYIPDEERSRMFILYTADEMDRRMYGRFMMVEGAVWKEYNPTRHVITPFDIPESWPRLGGIDFGYEHPFVCLWAAKDPADDTIYFYREYWKQGTLFMDHARYILAQEEHPIRVFVADHDAQGCGELESHGVVTQPAEKNVELGIQTVNRLFKQDKIKIFATLKQTLSECAQYHYRPGTEQPDKKQDDTQDTLRYIVMHVARTTLRFAPIMGTNTRTYHVRS
jgi:phage terminase large subunit-like protein